MDKAACLEKFKNKEFGGEPRQVKIETLEISGKTASAKVTLKGSKMTLVSFLQLVQDHSGTWKLVSDLPTIIYLTMP